MFGETHRPISWRSVSATSQFLDFFYWMVFDLLFYFVTVKMFYIGCKMLGKWLNRPMQLCICYSVLEVWTTLLAWRKTTYSINKRQIPARGKFTKYSKCSRFAICIFLKSSLLLKCSLLARKNWQLLVLAKINTLLACSQMLAKTIRYPSCYNILCVNFWWL